MQKAFGGSSLSWRGSAPESSSTDSTLCAKSGWRNSRALTLTAMVQRSVTRGPTPIAPTGCRPSPAPAAPATRSTPVCSATGMNAPGSTCPRWGWFHANQALGTQLSGPYRPPRAGSAVRTRCAKCPVANPLRASTGQKPLPAWRGQRSTTCCARSRFGPWYIAKSARLSRSAPQGCAAWNNAMPMLGVL